MEGTYLFAGARFDPKGGVLLSRGRSTALRPRTAAVLGHLLRHAGQVVTKDDLLQAVWTDLVVTENSLAQCVKEIRRELGDADEKLLRTVHRRGYILETKVALEPGAPPSNARRPLSLMVLPLVSLGGDSELDYFADGLTEDLTVDLGRMAGSFVIGRGTAIAYANRHADAREIGRELAVRYLVEGSVRCNEREIVVNLSVTDTQSACQVWADRLEAQRTEVLPLQRSMAGRIAHMLHLDLIHEKAEHPERGGGNIADAYELAMRAHSLKMRSVPRVSKETDALVRKAIELDPGCAYAWAVLSDANLIALATRNETDAAAQAVEAEFAARTALSLEPDHRTANCSLGASLIWQARFEEALGHLDRQMSLNPNHAAAHNWTGIAHILMGNSHLAIGPLQAAIDLSPRDPRLSTWIRSLALAWMHQGEDGRGLIDAERSVSVPNVWPRSYETLAMACAVNGLMEEARAAVRMLQRHWPGYSIAQHRAEMISSRPAFLVQRERLLEGLRLSGLPEQHRAAAADAHIGATMRTGAP